MKIFGIVSCELVTIELLNLYVGVGVAFGMFGARRANKRSLTVIF